jgi:hypothetical protein
LTGEGPDVLVRPVLLYRRLIFERALKQEMKDHAAAQRVSKPDLGMM